MYDNGGFSFAALLRSQLVISAPGLRERGYRLICQDLERKALNAAKNG